MLSVQLPEEKVIFVWSGNMRNNFFQLNAYNLVSGEYW